MKTITTTEELTRAIAPLYQESFITIDTEFLREKTYYPRVCLIQVGSSETAFAVDPMAENIDLTPLYDILKDTHVLKVFHAAMQDLEIFYLLMQCLPTPLFDSQIAAQILGIGEAVGYGKLVEDICHVKLDKSSRHTDWTQRPLSDKQIDYALSDVTYLRDIYENLNERLHKQERESWFAEEMEKLSDTEQFENNPDKAWEKLNLTNGNATFKSISCALATWREHYAREKNKPRAWILKNDAIYELASIFPKEEKDLKNLRFFNAHNSHLNAELLAVIEEGSHNPPPAIPKRKRNNLQINTIIDVLKLLLKHQCDIHNIVPSVVAKSSELQQLAEHDNPDVPAMKGWRYQIFGQMAQELKNGKLAITIDNGKVNIVTH